MEKVSFDALTLDDKVKQEPQPRRFTRRTLFKLGGAAAAGGALVALGFGTDWFTNLPLGDQISSQSRYYQVFLQSGCQAGDDLYLGAKVIVPEQADAPKGIETAGTMYAKNIKTPTEYAFSGEPIDLHITPKPMIYFFSGTTIKPGKNGIFSSQTVVIFDSFGKIAEFKTEPLKQNPAEIDSFTDHGYGIQSLVLLPADNLNKEPKDVHAVIIFHSNDLDWNFTTPPSVPYALKLGSHTIKQGVVDSRQGGILFDKLDMNKTYGLIINEGKLPSFRVWFTPKNLFQYDY